MNELPNAPNNEIELLDRASQIAGYSLKAIANSLNMSTPENLNRHKGWIGNLLEYYLGAKAGSKPEQDFSELGIELKTLPINQQGLPLETTFVSVAPLINNQGITWETSHVRYKLSKVLWIPVEGDRSIPIAERRIGVPILWQPSLEQEQQLKEDWQELMDMIVLGKVEYITAKIGQYLQIRPKAANGKALTQAYNESGDLIYTRPRGFYLRKNFTTQILTDFAHQ